MVSHYHNLLISSSFSLSKNVFSSFYISVCVCVCVCVYVAKARGRKASKLPGGVRRVVQTGGVVRTQSMPHSRDRFHSQQHQQRRPVAPELSPNSTATFSPPPLTSGESSATPGKSNLKQSSQFERKREGSPAKTTADEETNLLPEIPTIEVLSSGTEEEGGEGSKVGKTPVKGVRFADEVDEEEEEEGVRWEVAKTRNSLRKQTIRRCLQFQN
ncbi:hypothetical protein GBAR_LOCUS14358 [Geodia barretti]|uniref:Uncharacterized protein n=1 Tax=Geodia barretti TaxID=519541 RepID=A0AA35S8V0_GEOBA|nr:hypothetical protein GBAR_LOCUS14358 [Geodia barretti]